MVNGKNIMARAVNSKSVASEDIAYIMNVLRQGTIKWSGRRECLRRARKRVLIGKYKNGNPEYKYHWQCADCKNWFKNEKEMEVDHIIEIGPFVVDWNTMVPKIYCGQDNLACLCQSCHLRKTKKFNSAATLWKRKK